MTPETAPADDRPTPMPRPISLPTREVRVRVGERGEVAFQVATGGTEPACFALGVRKSGSTMLHKIVNLLARRNGVNSVDIAGAFFRSGFRATDWALADLSAVVAPGNVYVGFRNLPAALEKNEEFRRARKVFMFRDPRDALVSQYFSDAYSHSLPSRETEQGRKAAEAFEQKRAEALATSIDDYVLKHARPFDNTLMAYAGTLSDPSCLPLRYEEYVFQKRRLIHKILKHFGWTCPPGQVDAILGQVDEVPDSEDQKRFVRRVIPGDHRNKLQPETIRRLNNQLRESMHHFDYY
jgi:hypothetical protein